LAYNYINQVDWFLPPNEAGPRTKEAAEKALSIDQADAGAHLSLAIETEWYDWNWAVAEREFQRSIDLSRDNSEARAYYAWFLAALGRNGQALVEAKRSLQGDPLSSLANFAFGSVLFFARQWDAAIDQLRSARDLDPTFWIDACFLARVYEQKGRLPEAIAEFQRAVELGDNSETRSGLGHALALAGNSAEARKVLDRLKELSADDWVAPYNVAIVYAGLREKDQAFAWLDQAYKSRSYYLVQYLPTDTRLDGLRSDARFVQLRRRVGLPESP
jgi:tetratricopeptide (TPR) repeat protein